MENWLTASLPIIIKMSVTAIFIFLSIIIITKIAGLRTFAKMSSFDFASTIAVGSILASTIMNNQQSLLKGALALAMIVSMQMIFSYLKRTSNMFSEVATNDPLLLMDGSDILYKNLAKAGIAKSDLMAKLREANVLQLSEVHAVVLETTGDVSVLHSDDNLMIDPILLEDINR